MSRNFISIVFSIIFVASLIAPTVIAMVDDSIDISVFYTSSEEEEKENEKNKDIEVFVSEIYVEEDNLLGTENTKILGYYFNNYLRPHLNLISPPPELHIL